MREWPGPPPHLNLRLPDHARGDRDGCQRWAGVLICLTLPSFPGDSHLPVVTDASVIVNLVATRTAGTIIGAFPHRFLVTSNVCDELSEGRSRGHGSWEGLEALVAAGAIEPVDLEPSDAPVYRSLVEGGAQETLDDGEAATIAYAVGRGALALIDERKTRRSCDARFPTLRSHRRPTSCSTAS